MVNTYKITLLALLAALAIIGRVVFTFIPNVQPVTSIIMICGVILGPLSAVLLALVVTFVSNMIMGMGLWTIWQTIAWSLIGILSGLLGKMIKPVPLPVIIIFSVFCGYLYGIIISLTTYQVAGKFWPYYLAGLPFDTNHAIGNAIFMILFYPVIAYFLKKYANDHL